MLGVSGKTTSEIPMFISVTFGSWKRLLLVPVTSAMLMLGLATEAVLVRNWLNN